MPDSFLSSSLSDIGASIQFAIAPIFLLVASAAILNVVTTRLGRIVDRARVLESLIDAGEDAALEQRHLAELLVLDQRMKFSNRAVLFCAVAAVLICLLVGSLFVMELASVSASYVIAVIFIGVVVALSVGLLNFLLEVSLATRALRVRTEILTRERATETARTGGEVNP